MFLSLNETSSSYMGYRTLFEYPIFGFSRMSGSYGWSLCTRWTQLVFKGSWLGWTWEWYFPLHRVRLEYDKTDLPWGFGLGLCYFRKDVIQTPFRKRWLQHSIYPLLVRFMHYFQTQMSLVEGTSMFQLLDWLIPF